MKELKKDVPS
jgi:hypothetical protein